MESSADLNNRFTFHPADSKKANTHSLVRSSVQDAAYALYAFIPPSRELSLAITKLEEAMFWANAAVARMDSKGERL